MKQSPEIRDLVLRFHDAVSTGKPFPLERFFADRDELRLVGTAPGELATGHDAYHALIALFSREVAAKGQGVRIVGSSPEAFEEGTVGWVNDCYTLRLPDGKEGAVRFTAVLHREEGDWRVVQCHASLGVRNEEVFGTYFPE